MNPQVFEFFGVSTSGSSAMRLFQRWMKALEIGQAVIRGVDLPLGQDLSHHRNAVLRLKRSPSVRGALVTSHKLAVVRAAGDLIDQLTPDAQLCGEVSALYKRGDQLWGHACDPENCGRAMQHFMGEDWWDRHPEAQVLSLGGGGATIAMLVHLLTQAPTMPQSVTVTEKRVDNLEHCQAVTGALESHGMPCNFVHTDDPKMCDILVSALPPGSLIVNATGMGKDIPGSPVTGHAMFPKDCVVWELNYRGDRPFLQQARAQAQERNLIVEDGWHYFLYGWSSVIGLVFDVPITPTQFDKFASASRHG